MSTQETGIRPKFHYVLKHPTQDKYYHVTFGSLASDLQFASRFDYENSATAAAKMIERQTGVKYTVVKVVVDKQTGFMEPVESDLSD